MLASSSFCLRRPEESAAASRVAQGSRSRLRPLNAWTGADPARYWRGPRTPGASSGRTRRPSDSACLRASARNSFVHKSFQAPVMGIARSRRPIGYMPFRCGHQSQPRSPSADRDSTRLHRRTPTIPASPARIAESPTCTCCLPVHAARKPHWPASRRGPALDAASSGRPTRKRTLLVRMRAQKQRERSELPTKPRGSNCAP